MIRMRGDVNINPARNTPALKYFLKDAGSTELRHSIVRKCSISSCVEGASAAKGQCHGVLQRQSLAAFGLLALAAESEVPRLETHPHDIRQMLPALFIGALLDNRAIDGNCRVPEQKHELVTRRKRHHDDPVLR